MTPAREALLLPFLLISAALVAGLRVGARLTFEAPSLFSLMLAVLLIGALVRSGALDPSRLLHGSRPPLANANGFVVMGTLFAASAGVLSMVMPETGLPRFFVCVFLGVLLVNTLVARPARVPLLRSLAVILGAGVMLKFVVLASLSEPGSTVTGRVMVALFDAATFGTVAQDPQPASAGYLAFLAAGLLLVASALLPSRRVGLEAASPMQLPPA